MKSQKFLRTLFCYAIINRTVHMKLHGFCYTSFMPNGFTHGQTIGALSTLQEQTASNAVSLNIFHRAEHTSSHVFSASPKTSTIVDIEIAIGDARDHNLEPMLKIHVDAHGSWRAMLYPEHAEEWFNNYEKLLIPYLQLAQQNNISIVCIGCEYISATQSKFTYYWERLIERLRKHYNGALTYGANFNPLGSNGLLQPEFEQVEFWNHLDYIGIDAYFPLTKESGESAPSLEIATSAMKESLQPIFDLAKDVQRPVIFTEFGIPSVQGALAKPWAFEHLSNHTSAVQDQSIQALYYHAVLQSLQHNPQCAALYWWNWESVVTESEHVNFTPRGKNAAAILKEWNLQNL